MKGRAGRQGNSPTETISTRLTAAGSECRLLVFEPTKLQIKVPQLAGHGLGRARLQYASSTSKGLVENPQETLYDP